MKLGKSIFDNKDQFISLSNC